LRRVRVTKERLYSEKRKRKSIRNHERGTGQLNLEKQKANRIK
jgi:hypothetical protein